MDVVDHPECDDEEDLSPGEDNDGTRWSDGEGELKGSVKYVVGDSCD